MHKFMHLFYASTNCVKVKCKNIHIFFMLLKPVYNREKEREREAERDRERERE